MGDQDKVFSLDDYELGDSDAVLRMKALEQSWAQEPAIWHDEGEKVLLRAEIADLKHKLAKAPTREEANALLKDFQELMKKAKEKPKQRSRGRFSLPDWLHCPLDGLENLMIRLQIDYDPEEKRYIWTYPLWAGKFVIYLMVQRRFTAKRPKWPVAFNQLFVKINREGELMTLKQLEDALRSSANDYRGKSGLSLYKKIEIDFQDAFFPGAE